MPHELNEAMRRVAIPPRMAKLPVDERGYLVPKFVEWVGGKPEFRAFRREHFNRCVQHRMCWLCGEKLGKYLAFVIGPMCSISRTTSEPPSHLECARFATKVCPFMVYPKRPRDESNLPSNVIDPAGIHIAHNPGAMCIWITKDYRTFQSKGGERAKQGTLINIGEPISTEWWTQGRIATPVEALRAMQLGIPFLRAEAERDGGDAVKVLNIMIGQAIKRIPEQ